MFRASIISLKTGNITHSSMGTNAFIGEWIKRCESSHCWGYKKDRWLTETDGTHADTRTYSTEKILVSDEGVEYHELTTEYFFPCEYKIEIQDITSEIEQERIRVESERIAAENTKNEEFIKKVNSLIAENESLKSELARIEEGRIPKITKLRNARNEALRNTDHTQLSDFYAVLVSQDKDAQKEIIVYRQYRQYLRDIPNTFPDLDSIPSFLEWRTLNNL